MRDGTCKTDARALLQNLRNFTIVNATDAAGGTKVTNDKTRRG